MGSFYIGNQKVCPAIVKGDTIAVTFYNDGTYGFTSSSAYLTINGETRKMKNIGVSKYKVLAWTLEKNTTYEWSCTQGTNTSGSFTTGTVDMEKTVG